MCFADGKDTKCCISIKYSHEGEYSNQATSSLHCVQSGIKRAIWSELFYTESQLLQKQQKADAA